MTSGGNNFYYFPENQLTKNSLERELGDPQTLSTLPTLLLRCCHHLASFTVLSTR